MKFDDERLYPVDERISGAGQEGGDAGRRAGCDRFRIPWLPELGLSSGDESRFPVRCDGRFGRSAAAI